MDIETRLQLIKGVGEEIITEADLRSLLETKEHPVAYDGFEPSGLAHIPFGIFRPLLLKDLMKAGIHFKLWLADWFAWINNKMGGDLTRIHAVGDYFIEVWKAAGVDQKKVEFIRASDSMDPEYWKKVILIAKNTTLNRANRMLTIMGRKEGEMSEVAQYFYPMMQTADIFHLKVDICQLGIDQRRANMLAREVGPKMNWGKPVIVSHHMLMGLGGMKTLEGYESNEKMDAEISSKMSKSKPTSCIYVHDSLDEIKKKIEGAFCPAKETASNPIMDYSKNIIFRAYGKMKLERSKKFGGDIEFEDYFELHKAYADGGVHPVDLKNAVAKYLDEMISPIREHFEKNKKAQELLQLVKSQEITR